MKGYLIISLLLLWGIVGAYGQGTPHKCKTDYLLEQEIKKNPAFEQEIEQSFKDFYKKRITSKPRLNAVIPVHVIIVHLPGQAVGTGNNLSYEHVVSQIEVLNEDFGRYNADAVNTPSVFSAANTGIQFCLATVDPNGVASSGITRYATNMDFESNESTIKAATGWPREDYLNVWVAPLGGVLGYAYLPTTSSLPNAILDGIVVGTPYFGGPGYGSSAPYHLGRTATHEVGHYLGLRHIWRNAGCGLDDGIADTPIQDEENFGCPTHPSPSCSNSGDMFMNYMDYTNDNCMNAFTEDQGEYMLSILTGIRGSLLSSSGAVCGSLAPLGLQIIETNPAPCFGEAGGSITFQGNGGQGGYTYTLSNGLSNTTGIFENLLAGMYEITVSDGQDIVTDDFEIGEAPMLEIISLNFEGSICGGENTGFIEVQAIGGTALGGYIYTLSNGASNFNGYFDELPNDSYTITIMDDNQCSITEDIILDGPLPLQMGITSISGVTCNGLSNAAISLTASGGTEDYKYFLDGIQSNSGIFTNLPAATYSVEVRDANNCMFDSTFTISEPEPLVTFLQPTPPLCHGSASGQIMVQTMGGTFPFTYTLDTTTQSSPVWSNLVSGTYIITTIDNNNCSFVDTLTLDQPNPLMGQVSGISGPVCQGSALAFAEINASGGTLPYIFVLSGDTTANGSFINLTPGEYEVFIIDQNQCKDTVAVALPSSPLINITTTLEEPSCFGLQDGSISTLLSGGTGALTWSLEGQVISSSTATNLDAGTYQIIVSDAVGCTESQVVTLNQPDMIEIDADVAVDECGEDDNWSAQITITGGSPGFEVLFASNTFFANIGSPINIRGQGQGQYEIQIQDENNCFIDTSFTVHIPLAMATSSIDVMSAECDSSILGSVMITIVNGQAPYEYELEGKINVNGMFDSLYAGIYNITVTDAIGCKLVVPVSIPVGSSGFGIESITATSLLCNGDMNGTITAIHKGGVGPITYQLGSITNENGYFENLGPGSYIVSIIDNGTNCTLVADTTIITEPSPLILMSEILYHQSGFISQIKLTGDGGTPPYEFAIDDLSMASGLSSYQNLEPGNHTLYIIDKNGCVNTKSIIISSNGEEQLWEGLKVYPNPALEELYVEINQAKSKNYRLNLLDINGRQVLTSIESRTTEDKFFHTFLVKNLAPSTYILKIASENGIIYRKVVVR